MIREASRPRSSFVLSSAKGVLYARSFLSGVQRSLSDQSPPLTAARDSPCLPTS